MMRGIQRKLLGGLVAALAIGLVAACGDGSDPEPPSEQTAAPSEQAAAPSEQTAASPTTAPTSADASAAAPSAPPVQVVTTTNFVADWARVVGGDRVEVFGLLPPGGDPHTFQPGPRDVAKVADADVVFTVGLGLEADWLEDLLHNASADDSKLVALGDGVDPVEFATADLHDDHGDEDAHGDDHGDEDAHEDDHGDEDAHGDDHGDEDAHEDDHGDDHGDEDAHEDDHGDEDAHEDDHGDDHGDEDAHEDDHGDEDAHEDDHGDEDAHEDDHGDDHGDEDAHEDDHGDEHGHDHGSLDPHFWFDPIRVKIAVNAIADRLAAIDPESASVYRQNAAEYGQQLDELHAWTQEQVSAVAPERRLLVTSHDAFSYFAGAYGFEIVGLVIPSLATHVEPSAEHVEGVVRVVREYGIPAVFGETTVSERLAQAIARETGAELVRLYSGSLGPEGSGADTYLTMVRTNVERIVEALR